MQNCWLLYQAFFWTKFRNIYQLRIGGFSSFGPNSLSFLSKYLSLFLKKLSFPQKLSNFMSLGTISIILNQIIFLILLNSTIFSENYTKKVFRFNEKTRLSWRNWVFLQNSLSFLKICLSFFKAWVFFLEFFFGRPKKSL